MFFFFFNFLKKNAIFFNLNFFFTVFIFILNLDFFKNTKIGLNFEFNHFLKIFLNIYNDSLFGLPYSSVHEVHNNINKKWLHVGNLSEHYIKHLFQEDLSILFVRHKLYLDQNLEKDLTRILTVLNLRWSLLTKEELM